MPKKNKQITPEAVEQADRLLWSPGSYTDRSGSTGPRSRRRKPDADEYEPISPAAVEAADRMLWR